MPQRLLAKTNKVVFLTCLAISECIGLPLFITQVGMLGHHSCSQSSCVLRAKIIYSAVAKGFLLQPACQKQYS